MKKVLIFAVLFTAVGVLVSCQSTNHQVKESTFVGANLWNGDITQLDALQAIGVTNIRVKATDGEDLDPLLTELEKRDMQAVLFLTNAWEWSTGYEQYYSQATGEKPLLPAEVGYQYYMEHAGRFLNCPAAVALFDEYVTQTINKYKHYKSIYAWEIANEPRAFGQDPDVLVNFIDHEAKLIKSLDPNHRVTTGSEGMWGCNEDSVLCRRVHEISEIDYMTCHIWPYNWGWLSRSGDTDNGLAQTDTWQTKVKAYIQWHEDIAARIDKPFIIEEFGFPRDNGSLEPNTPTTGRDEMYRLIFQSFQSMPHLIGANFWCWKQDPPQEPQGLNSVLPTDTTTLAIIRQYANPVFASTRYGKVQGFVEDDINIFLGVPYAQAPVGELRWREALPPLPYDTILQATHFGDDAIVPHVAWDMHYRGKQQSEDCLYLNIWAPKTNKSKLPVLVYFNGGGLITGSGSETRYDGKSLAQQGIIMVTANYRENIFGFFAHPELTARSAAHTSGNQGLTDQAQAIQWVYDNIANFGGDPQRITISGESAGSFSVSMQMCSPLSKDLLAGGIGSSGAVLIPDYYRTLEEAEQLGVKRTQEVGKTIDELLAMDAYELAKLMPLTDMPKPTIDGYFLTDKPENIYANNEQAQIPLMAGWNRNEDNPHWKIKTKPTLEKLRHSVFPWWDDKIEAIFDLYDIHTDADVFTRKSVDMCSDLFTGNCTWRWCDIHRQTGHTVYRYKFMPDRPLDSQPYDSLAGACHSADIEYSLGNLHQNTFYNWKERDHQLSKLFSYYTVNFIRCGNPNGEQYRDTMVINGKQVEEWLPLTEEGETMILDYEPYLKADPTLEERYHKLNSLFQ